ncbi:MAG: molybdenum cofactor guanylyltransferase [Pseudomonadota bacterium]|nr:molybdenum cofactor guanylyltransferase [Pseudomonadota bacterium]
MRVAGAIIAGGEASRMGGEKASLPFAGATLLEAVIARVRPQVDVLALNLRGDAPVRTDLPILADTIAGKPGPLAGIVTALEWAAQQPGVEWLATFPCDTPFLPLNLVAALRAAAKGDAPVVAHDGTATQNLCALWPLSSLDHLREAVVSRGLRRLGEAERELGAIFCPVPAPAHAFFNINTPDDLTEAERIALTLPQ